MVKKLLCCEILLSVIEWTNSLIDHYLCVVLMYCFYDYFREDDDNVGRLDIVYLVLYEKVGRESWQKIKAHYLNYG